MHAKPDHSVRDIGSTQLELRSELTFTPQLSAGQPYYMLEDPLNSRFFRLGLAEYTFISLLDGATSIHEALSHLSGVLPQHRITEADAAGLCKWLVEMDLAHTAESSGAGRLADAAGRVEQQKRLSKFNPLAFRLPLCRPDRVCRTLNDLVGWLYCRLAFFAWLLLVVVGAYTVFSDWEQFSLSSQGVIATGNWIWLGACWVVLKIAHEASHAIVCKRYGGEVRETGILFIFLAPLAYVDVTSSWRFRSRLQRIHVAAAGMYCELAIAAVAAIIWSHTDSGWINNLCCNTVLMASMATLVFNANPLMKFDGYFMLSDALAMPNLHANGRQCVRAWTRRVFLGIPTALPDWSRRRSAFIHIYGVASLLWQVLVCVSLTVAATTMFYGAGIALASLAIIMWLGLPVARFAKYFVHGQSGEQPQRLRFLVTAGSAAGFCILLFGLTPWPGVCEAPAVVEYSPHTVIRTASSGFVREIHVKSGQQVTQNQLLVVLENRGLTRELADIELQIRQSELRGRQHEHKGDLAAQQAEAKKRESLQAQLEEKRLQVNGLTVRAPHAGKVVHHDVDSLLETYLENGDEVLSVGNEGQKELHVSISQDDVNNFSSRTHQSVRVDVLHHPLWSCRLEEVAPRATRQLTHAAFSASNGGSIPVRPTTDKSSSTIDPAHEYLAPRFTAIVRLSNVESSQLFSGQRATVSYRPCNESVGQHLYNASSRWIRNQLAEKRVQINRGFR